MALEDQIKDIMDEVEHGPGGRRGKERRAELEHERALSAIRIQTAALIKAGAVEAPYMPSPVKSENDKTALNSRQAFVLPLLDAKGWSLFSWALAAKLAPDTVSDYLANKTRPYAKTRVKMAKALNIPVQQLPR
jgi:lambda repressor-like predicted transcriptional regulator